MENTERLQEYKFDDYTIVTNFETYQDAVNYAAEKNGELLEVGFTDGADNPLKDDTANLTQLQKPFRVSLPENNYDIYYSYDEGFQDLAEQLLFKQKRKENDMAPEDIIADQNIAPGDRIMIVDNGELNTITTRERIKFLMRGNLYEMAVKVSN